MSNNNIFQEVLSDAQGIQNKLLGPSYAYYKNIKTPSEIGMSDKGSMSALGKDISGLIDYVEILVSGKSKASATGGPLGNKFFLQTAAKCLDKQTNQQVDRYIYIDNVPNGNIPFISDGLGTNFADFKGLIPGTMSNLNVLNPFGILQSFLSGSNPECQEITMQTIDISNNISSETHYVTVSDIKNIDSCSFPNKQNPISNKKCKESFTKGVSEEATVVLPEDPIAQIYFVGLAGLAIYILYRLMEKNRA
jgi:hypothetical protein